MPGDGGSSSEMAQLAGSELSLVESSPSGQALMVLTAGWPELAELRPAASLPNVNRLRSAVTSFICNTRVQFAAALFEAGSASSAACEGEQSAIDLGRARHQAAQDLLRLGITNLSV